MLTLLATIVALSVLILVHELGHFLAAKSVGVDAPVFSLGLGPRVTGFRWGETDFVISAIPLGGYVKMAGMEDDEAAQALEGGRPAGEEEGGPPTPPQDPERTFDAKPLWARTWVISAGVVMNLLFALVANIVIVGVRGQEYVTENRLSPRAELGGPAAQLAGIPLGARVLAVGNEPVENWTEMQARLRGLPEGEVTLALESHPTVRLVVPAPGPSRDTLLAGLHYLSEPILGGLLPDRPAARAGLRPGDRIVAIDGERMRLWTDVTERVRASPDRLLRLEVERNGSTFTVEMTPQAEQEGDETVGRMGAFEHPPTAFERVGPVEAVAAGTRVTVGMTTLLLTTVRDLITGQLSPRNLGGLLTIGEASGQSAERGGWDYLFFLAFLSVNLAILNLLPIPILDGGHLLFLAIEAVRGRPLSIEARIRLSHVGLLIVVGLMLWANGNDIVRLVERLMTG